ATVLCAFCQLSVLPSRHALQCCLCRGWQHRVCHRGNKSGVSHNDYLDLMDKRNIFTWQCCKCPNPGRQIGTLGSNADIHADDNDNTLITVSSSNTTFADTSHCNPDDTVLTISSVNVTECVDVSQYNPDDTLLTFSSDKGTVCTDVSHYDPEDTVLTIRTANVSQYNPNDTLLKFSSDKNTVCTDVSHYDADDTVLTISTVNDTVWLDVSQEGADTNDNHDNTVRSYTEAQFREIQQEAVDNTVITVCSSYDTTTVLLDEVDITEGQQEDVTCLKNATCDRISLLEGLSEVGESLRLNKVYIAEELEESKDLDATVICESLPSVYSSPVLYTQTVLSKEFTDEESNQSEDGYKTIIDEEISTVIFPSDASPFHKLFRSNQNPETGIASPALSICSEREQASSVSDWDSTTLLPDFSVGNVSFSKAVIKQSTPIAPGSLYYRASCRQAGSFLRRISAIKGNASLSSVVLTPDTISPKSKALPMSNITPHKVGTCNKRRLSEEDEEGYPASKMRILERL
ncbi:unnamed protein product, partial [Meganyctiphanes norvegica]